MNIISQINRSTNTKKHMQVTKVFAKAGLDNVTSAKCRHQQQFGLEIYFSNIDREWITKIVQDSVLRQLGWVCCFNVKFTEWATEQHGAEKAMFLARQFWQFRKLYGDPSFTPDILSTIKANWLVVQGDNDEAVPLQQAIEMHQYIPNS